jgi:hypothetical protein
MLSLIEVQCPHCGAKGQIMVPPVGSIIIGPCPQCQELVVVFCGQVLALQKGIMTEGSLEERQNHLLAVLTDFLGERVRALMTEESLDEFEAVDDDAESPNENAETAPAVASKTPEQRKDISQVEFDRFIEVDLKLLDNKAYFESIFEGK